MELKLNTLTAHELIQKLAKKEITSGEIIVSLKERIQNIGPKVKAYVRFSADDFSYFELQTPILKDTLTGIPISIKDNICTEGVNTECCSRILKGFKPPYDATVIRRLKNAGAIILRIKTNMDEFAFGSSTENSYFGPACNPWDLERVAGGSSGGAAAAVSSDEAIAALGSDTGGSIRQPASFCGVVGFKPTYGRVSRYGLIAFASSLDQIGPITKDVRDCVLLMDAISGYDENDSTSVNIPSATYADALINDAKGFKVAIPKEYFVEGLDPEVKTAIEEAITKLKSLGAVCREVSLPHTEYAVPVYYIIATAEASSNLARFDGVQYGYRTEERGEGSPPATGQAGYRVEGTEDRLINMYKKTRGEALGEEAKRRILLGTFVLSHGFYDAYYLRALKVRTLIKEDFDNVFKEFDCIITPTSPTPAFIIGEKSKDPLSMYLSDIYTISANLAGIPAISIPCGFTKNGLPIGLQILSKPFNEEMLLRLAYTYEQNTPWHLEKPRI